ncbi:MAG: DNA methyltransferase, partial [Bacteroidota bacterium]
MNEDQPTMKRKIRLIQGDSFEVMASYPEASIGAVICDPPYGISFMGKNWDKLEVSQAWQFGGELSKPGIGERAVEWVSISGGDPVHGTANPTCADCGGRLRGKKKCSCEQPHDHWKPLGPSKNAEEIPVELEDSDPPIRPNQAHEMQKWHEAWLTEAYRVLVPGGLIKAFAATRTMHRLAMAMQNVGFDIVKMEAWVYGSGFPKSLNISKALEK